MGSACSLATKEFAFVPENDVEYTRTVMNRDGEVRVYARSRRGSKPRIKRNTI